MPSGPVGTGALSAALLTLCVLATPLSLAQPSLHSSRTERLTKFFEWYWDTINRVQSERDLAGVEARLDLTLWEVVAYGNQYLKSFTKYKADAEAARSLVKTLEEQIAAERSRAPQIDPEIGALEGAIAETKGEIAGLEGRQRRVVELEGKLRDMRDVEFMQGAPRERLQVDLEEARRQVPNPNEIARLKTQLQGYEVQLQGKRARQPVPDASVLRQLEVQLQRARDDVKFSEVGARQAREEFQAYRGAILALGEAVSWLKELIAFKRQALAAPTRIAPAFRACETNLGPFRCTGTFDASWDSVCTSDTQSRDSGHATVVFSHDGYVKAQLQSNTPGGSPTTFIGPINAAGQVKGGRSSEDDSEQWQGAFSLVTSALPSGASKPIGGGTYTYVLRLASGGSVRCSGTLKLL